MMEFSYLISNPELGDVHARGSKYTWFNMNGSVMSLLDGFILSEGLIIKWNVRAQFVEAKLFQTTIQFGSRPIYPIGDQNLSRCFHVGSNMRIL